MILFQKEGNNTGGLEKMKKENINKLVESIEEMDLEDSILEYHSEGVRLFLPLRAWWCGIDNEYLSFFGVNDEELHIDLSGSEIQMNSDDERKDIQISNNDHEVLISILLHAC